MTYEHQMWLLDMVDELKIHPRVAKLRAANAAEEWRVLERLVIEELRRRDPLPEPEDEKS